LIVGIGTDIIKNERIEALLISSKQRFLQRLFTPNEIILLDSLSDRRLVGYVAKRFAAKEAFSKALGTGIGKDLSFQDLEILSNSKNKPYFKFSIKLQNLMQSNYGKNLQAHLSLADEHEYAQAFVIIEKIE
jgi:holo-[acyl-carrier protein] synthase